VALAATAPAPRAERWYRCRPPCNTEGVAVQRNTAVLHLVALVGCLVLVAACADAPSRGTTAANLPPPNPFLARSGYAIGHADAAQSDSSPVRGPLGPSRTLEPGEIAYRALGPGHFGAGVSSRYPDGRRVVWSNGRENFERQREVKRMAAPPPSRTSSSSTTTRSRSSPRSRSPA
jgi:hypothetical protein